MSPEREKEIRALVEENILPLNPEERRLFYSLVSEGYKEQLMKRIDVIERSRLNYLCMSTGGLAFFI